MRTKSISKGVATGPSQWIPLDSDVAAFAVGFIVGVQGGASLTYKVQMGFVDMQNDWQNTDNMARVGAVNTITFGANHGLQVGDSVVIQGAGAPFDGTFDVASVPGTTSITVAVANSGPTAPQQGSRLLKIHVTDHPIVVGQTTSQVGNVAFPCNLIRVNITTWVSGQVDFTVTQGMDV